jgi:hypothetical protein
MPDSRLRRLNVVMPSLARELEALLLEAEEPELAAQIVELEIVDRCRCGARDQVRELFCDLLP